MSVFRRWHPLGQTKEKMAPSFAAPVPFGSNKRSLRKFNPHPRNEDEKAERAWGVGLKKCEAEDLLDWLEAHGRSGKLTYVAGKGFTIRATNTTIPRPSTQY